MATPDDATDDRTDDRVGSWDHNLITLGDFNIDRKGDALHDAFISTGLEIPADLQEVPRTIFSDPETSDLHKFYDQIAWFTGQNGLPALSPTMDGVLHARLALP